MTNTNKLPIFSLLFALAGVLLIVSRPGERAHAQTPVTPTTAAYYQAVDAATSSSVGSESLTIQNVPSGKKIAVFQSASADCTVACILTVYQNGTAPTSTLLTPNTYNAGVTGIAASPVSLAYSASNAGVGGWAHPPPFPVLAGSTYAIDISKFFMDFSSSQNLTLKITWSGSNTYALKIIWEEQ